MNSVVATTLTALLLSLPIALASSSAPAAQEDGNCVSSRQAQEAVEAGEILDLSAAAQREGIDRKFIGDEARLCDVEGSPHWVVNVMSESGDSERIVLNAQGD
jgi:hypothetical protein